ncbi:MAG: acetate--CoA ligase family protein [Desulfobacterales bacterium]|nr:acetate--CoA ligase family protein [Desulfobacterales bacterium]MDD4071600.1 acetate--CoA ligase family protein [Desulfobacterales bacterium]MDD4392636.1 acetate--CoA ligase family protein [Desulfobacterales bacterium]
MNNLDAIFSPGSVAVIGASAKTGKVGHDIFANILKGGFTGTLYPVNPGAKSILSVRAYPTVLDIPEDIDLAIVIVPPQAALGAVEDSIRKGVRGIVIVSAGFREIGKQGLELENTILAKCREAGVRLVGPNCLGVINPMAAVRLNASFSTRMPAKGNISFISQSGALCTAVLDFAADRDFGFSKFISTGNKADVDELDLLRYLHRDPDTNVIMIYLEELRRGPEFIETVREITSGARPTPVLVIKSGRTSAGAKAAASHTGSLAGSEAVYDAIFQQAGILRAETIDELFDMANAFNYKQETALGKLTRKLPAGNRVAIVTNAGGPGILATDVTISSGLALAEFSPETVRTLASHLPSAANLNNPVDVIGDAASDRYEYALEAVINDDGVDGALVILTPQSMTNALGTAEAIVRIARRSHKPILCCFMGIVDVSPGVKYLQEHGYPVYKFPENAAKAFSAMYRFSMWINRRQLAEYSLEHDRKQAAQIIGKCLDRGQTYLGELDGLALLKCYGFNVLPTELSTTADEAAGIAEKIGYPVVMKIVSPQIIHKSDAGGVKVGLKTADEVRRAFDAIVANAAAYDPEAQITGVLIQKMAPSGQEVILGVNRYPIFGPLLMFGLGGVFVEVFKDVAFRLAPIGRNAARRMIQSIKGYKLFTGFRGKPEADVDAMEKLLICLSDMVTNHPEIQELDINPLLVHEKGNGTTVADCRIILNRPVQA